MKKTNSDYCYFLLTLILNIDIIDLSKKQLNHIESRIGA